MIEIACSGVPSLECPLCNPSGTRPAKLVLLDRDGVLIANRSDYVKSVAEVSLLPGAGQALRLLAQAGYALTIVTNQSVIGRGIATAEEIAKVQRHVGEILEAAVGIGIHTFLCPHAPDARCRCRKPEPGLLTAAVARFGVSPANCHLVGDARSDILAARRLGVPGILVRTGRGGSEAAHLGDVECSVLDDILAAAHLLIGHAGRGT